MRTRTNPGPIPNESTVNVRILPYVVCSPFILVVFVVFFIRFCGLTKRMQWILFDGQYIQNRPNNNAPYIGFHSNTQLDREDIDNITDENRWHYGLFSVQYFWSWEAYAISGWLAEDTMAKTRMAQMKRPQARTKKRHAYYYCYVYRIANAAFYWLHYHKNTGFFVCVRMWEAELRMYRLYFSCSIQIASKWSNLSFISYRSPPSFLSHFPFICCSNRIMCHVIQL